MKVAIRGVGLFAPGLVGWDASRFVLTGETPYVPDETPIPPPPILNPNERRRAVPMVRLALGVAHEAVTMAAVDPATLPCVFASSGGDGETMHAILEALVSPMREVSPTRFTSSVHNAPSGYWTIAAGCREPATSLCAYDYSFAIGLLEAATQCVSWDKPVLLACYDAPYLEPLHSQRRLSTAFGMAFVLVPSVKSQAMACLDIQVLAGETEDTMLDPHLETLRRTNPSARSLPLLHALAAGKSARVCLESTFGNSLAIEVSS